MDGAYSEAGKNWAAQASHKETDLEHMFLEAYDQYADAIFRHCYFRVFSKARAEELMQEAFMKTWQYLESGREVRNIRAFLYRVANNLIIDEARKKKEESLDRLLEESEGAEPESGDNERMERQAAAREVLEIIKELNAEDREVLIMRYVDDLEPREIAAVLGMSPNAVSVRIHRATQSLKKRLGE